MVTPNNDRSVFFAENILAALEAFLATSLDAPLIPYLPEIAINIIPTDFQGKALEWMVVEGEPRIDVRHTTADEDPEEFHNLLPELIITITTRIALSADTSHYKKLLHDEEAMARALCIANVGISITNVLGNKPKMRISDWSRGEGEAYALQRTEAWNAGVKPTPKIKKPMKFGSGSPPRELLDPEKQRHRNRRIVSLIDLPIWDKAGWMGTAYGGDSGQRVPLMMALLFRDKAAGLEIFKGLRRELGAKDETGRLRVTILTGIDRRHPAHYRFIIGSNLDLDSVPKGAQFATIVRVHTMTPETSKNLDRFLDEYKRVGAYHLLPAYFETGETRPTHETQLGVLLSELNVRPAWEVAENDPDRFGILETDEVVIPAGVIDAPILKTIELIKRIKKQRANDGRPPRSDAGVPKIGRNERCPCGSGKKYKKCHGA